VYVGQYPFNEGFWLTPEEATTLLKQHPNHREVLFPYMIGRDLVDSGTPSRWIIDFGQREMTEAMHFKAAFQRVEKVVMPVVLAKGDREKEATGKESTRWSRLSKRWWQLRDYQPGTMAAISAVPRYIACSRVTKRPVFEFISPRFTPTTRLWFFRCLTIIRSAFYSQAYIGRGSPRGALRSVARFDTRRTPFSTLSLGRSLSAPSGSTSL